MLNGALIPSSAQGLFLALFVLMSLGAASVDRDRLECKCEANVSDIFRPFVRIFAVVQEKIRCCQSNTLCKLYDPSAASSELLGGGGGDENGMFCFSDISCISFSDDDDAGGDGNKCGLLLDSCYRKQFQRYKVYNSLGEHSEYKCQSISDLRNGSSLCLLKDCDSFMAVIRRCKCDGELSCMCYTSDEVAESAGPLQFSAFFTFAEKYTVPQKKSKFLVAFLSCLGAVLSVVVLMTLYRLGVCSGWSERTRNMDIFSKFSRSDSTTRTCRTDTDQGLPSYEQAMRSNESSTPVVDSASRY